MDAAVSGKKFAHLWSLVVRRPDKLTRLSLLVCSSPSSGFSRPSAPWHRYASWSPRPCDTRFLFAFGILSRTIQVGGGLRQKPRAPFPVVVATGENAFALLRALIAPGENAFALLRALIAPGKIQKLCFQRSSLWGKMHLLCSERSLPRGKIQKLCTERLLHLGKMHSLCSERSSHRGKIQKLCSERSLHREKIQKLWLEFFFPSRDDHPLRFSRSFPAIKPGQRTFFDISGLGMVASATQEVVWPAWKKFPA